MLQSVLAFLTCPTCKSAFSAKRFQAKNGRVMEGFLICAACGTATPVSHGFPLFGETQLDRPSLDESWLAEHGAHWFRADDYEGFLREKAARNMRDSYAFFQPFNESSRALLALLEPLRKSLSPGDLILDTWCRTGWSGEWLASLFPQQQVISLWEGNSNVLGYAGFQYWLPDEERASNLNIVFTHADRHLPLNTNSVQLIVGLDSLHRYAQDTFLAECLRVTKDNGVLFFPHIHLANSEPVPFFERGCLQLLGDDWELILNRHCNTGSRKAYIFAEPELFDCGARFTIHSNPATEHYNGAALLAPRAWDGLTVATGHKRDISEQDYLFVNPLVEINLDEARVALSKDRPRLEVGELLHRHPIYEQRLEKLLGQELSEIECEVLFHSRRGKKLQEICRNTEHPELALRAAAEHLCEREILFAASVSARMARLQAYYGYLELPNDGCGSFTELWATLPARYRHHPILLDEEGVSYDFESVEIMVRAAGHWLRSASVAGDKILTYSENCPELFILIWACWLNGRVVVPVDAQSAPETVAGIIKSIKPAVCFSSKPLDTTYYQFDSLAGDNKGEGLFSDLLAPCVETADPPDYIAAPQDVAAILFTSGSTGFPKGVSLSQGSLTHSADVLAQQFNWKETGVLLSLGAMHSMSGLRNPAVAALTRGMTILVPTAGTRHPLQIYSLMSQHQVTHLSTVPSLLVSFQKMASSLAAERRPPSLEQIITTGYSLPAATQAYIEESLDVPVYSYYGLTETGGICLADSVVAKAEGNLGFSVGAIAQVRDSSGRALGPGVAGELCIYSAGRASGYIGDGVDSSVRFQNGWVHTGDIAQMATDGSFHYIGRRDDQVKDRWGETMYLQEVECAASALDCVADCCCAIHVGPSGELDTLVLFAVARESGVESLFTSELYTKLRETLGNRKLPQKIISVPLITRFSNAKADRKSMLSLYFNQETYAELSQQRERSQE